MGNVRATGLEGSGKWVAITPDNSNDITVTRGIYIGGAGNLVADSDDGQTSVTFTGLLAGVIYPLKVKRVRTSSTATNMVALY